ncbi:MAG: HEAT repeat domain-containing protein [Planctomycetota bacterium]|nr:HEAT repeat domain-containing protein [Planctomycetota bacterium]
MLTTISRSNRGSTTIAPRFPPRGEVSPGLVIGIAAAVVVLGAVAFLALDSSAKNVSPAPAVKSPPPTGPEAVQPTPKNAVAMPNDEKTLLELVQRLDKKLEGNQYQEITGALQRMGKQAVPFLAQWLQSGDQRKAASAAVVISIIKGDARDPAIQAELTKWIQTPTRKERDMAVLALCSLGPDAKEAVPLLTGLLEEKNADVREMAVTGLGALGPDAKEAVPALTKLLAAQTQNGEPTATFTEQALARIKAAPGAATDPASILQKARPGEGLFAGPVDYLDVLPANTIIAAQLRNLGESIENAKKTAVGQLVQSDPLAPFRQRLDAALNENAGAWKKFTTWAERFKGQFAIGVWGLDFQDPGAMKFVAIAEITDPAPQAVLDAFLQETALFRAVPETESYRGVNILKQEPRGPAVALAGRHLMLSANAESIKRVIGGFAVPGAGLSAAPEYARARAALKAAPAKEGEKAAPKPELLFVMDFEGYTREIGKAMGAALGPKEAEAFQNVMSSAGNMKLLAMSSANAGEGFEDHYVVTFSGEPKGFAAVTRMPPDATPPLNAMALVPPNAAMATASYMNGAELHAAAMEYLGSVKKMVETMPRPPQAGNRPPFPDIAAALKAFEEKTGLNVKELIGGIVAAGAAEAVDVH